jgi:hypothetical protein
VEELGLEKEHEMYGVMANATVHATSCGVKHRLGHEIASAIVHEIASGMVHRMVRGSAYKMCDVLEHEM